MTRADVDHAVEASQAPLEVDERVRRAFGPHWGDVSKGCRAAIRTGELVMDALRAHDEEEDIDFAPAIHVYSRALETELVDKIFEPFKKSGAELPATSGNAEVDKSIELLRRYTARPAAKAPTLDVMARCLLNIAYRLGDSPDNTFLLFLRGRMTEPDQFCREFPRKLDSYVQLFRNRAAHIDHISESDVHEARAFLLDEPRRLLVWLAEAMKPDAESPGAG